MLIDTHCHINMMIKKEFDILLTPQHFTLAETIVQEAVSAGVTQMITIGTNAIESNNCVQLAHHIEPVYASIGIHPCDTKTAWQQDLSELKKYITDSKVVAIGECGIDYHWPDYNAQQQKDAFRAHIELALKYDKALIIHSRDAYEDTMNIIEEYKDSLQRVVIHCFPGDLSAAQEAINKGFLLGIGGPVTYPKNNALRTIVKTVGLSHIILETDAPFLPPQIARGQQNHPRHIATIAHYLAQYLEIPYEQIASQTTANAIKLFRLDTKS